MYVVKPLVVECKKCFHLIEIQDIDLDSVSSYERNMGSELEYECELDCCCEKCSADINIKISVWEYPEGAVNHVMIESNDVSVIDKPVFSCYDDYGDLDE